MERFQYLNGGNNLLTFSFRATVPTIKAPRITATVQVDGETFYQDATGKLYRPGLFDKMFKLHQ